MLSQRKSLRSLCLQPIPGTCDRPAFSGSAATPRGGLPGFSTQTLSNAAFSRPDGALPLRAQEFFYDVYDPLTRRRGWCRERLARRAA